MTVVGLVLAAMSVTAGISLIKPSCVTGLVLALLSAAWFSVNNGVFEGPLLLPLSAQHGVTSSDLLAVLGAGLAVLSVVRWRAQVRAPGDDRSATADRSARERIATMSLIAIILIMILGIFVNVTYQPG